MGNHRPFSCGLSEANKCWPFSLFSDQEFIASIRRHKSSFYRKQQGLSVQTSSLLLARPVNVLSLSTVVLATTCLKLINTSLAQKARWWFFGQKLLSLVKLYFFSQIVFLRLFLKTKKLNYSRLLISLLFFPDSLFFKNCRQNSNRV